MRLFNYKFDKKGIYINKYIYLYKDNNKEIK
jgi:hypothetical protein